LVARLTGGFQLGHFRGSLTVTRSLRLVPDYSSGSVPLKKLF
jgi:hypothetical protein